MCEGGSSHLFISERQYHSSSASCALFLPSWFDLLFFLSFLVNSLSLLPSERIKEQVSSKLETADAALGASARGGSFGMIVGGGGGTSKDGANESALMKPANAAVGLAVEGCEGQMTQIAKMALFGAEPKA